MSRAGTADPTFPGRAKFGSKIARRNCEWHIARSGTEKLRPGELGDAYQPLLAHVKRSAQGPDEWADLEHAVAQLPGVPPRFEKWLLPEPRPPRARAGDDAAPPQPRR